MTNKARQQRTSIRIKFELNFIANKKNTNNEMHSGFRQFIRKEIKINNNFSLYETTLTTKRFAFESILFAYLITKYSTLTSRCPSLSIHCYSKETKNETIS